LERPPGKRLSIFRVQERNSFGQKIKEGRRVKKSSKPLSSRSDNAREEKKEKAHLPRLKPDRQEKAEVIN